MNLTAGIIILLLLLFGPITVHWIEEHIEPYILILGIAATVMGTGFNRDLAVTALEEPILITAAVVVAGIVFTYAGRGLDGLFSHFRRRVSRPVLAGVSVFVVGMISSVITAIIAALLLVEIVGLLQLRGEARTRVTIAGCFAIGLGAALTPIGEPLSTLASAALDLPFFGLFGLLAAWVIPGAVGASVLAGLFARGSYEPDDDGQAQGSSLWGTLLRAFNVYLFVAGLVLVSHAYGPIAARFVSAVSNDALFWINTVSAALDNATLVALEVHDMSMARAREAILSLLISGGMLIPGNIPNIVSASSLKIGSTVWARIGVPIGLVGLGIYFALIKLLA